MKNRNRRPYEGPTKLNEITDGNEFVFREASGGSTHGTSPWQRMRGWSLRDLMAGKELLG